MGSGVGQDDAKAAHYFLLATREKSKKCAQYMMGRIYAEGELRKTFLDPLHPPSSLAIWNLSLALHELGRGVLKHLPL